MEWADLADFCACTSVVFLNMLYISEAAMKETGGRDSRHEKQNLPIRQRKICVDVSCHRRSFAGVLFRSLCFVHLQNDLFVSYAGIYLSVRLFFFVSSKENPVQTDPAICRVPDTVLAL